MDILLDRYRLLEVVGRGPHATVYRARDGRTRCIRAVKVLSEEVEVRGNARFLAELLALLQLRHPHVISLHDAWLLESPHFLVSDLASGGSLARHVQRDAQFSVPEALHLALEALSGLAAAHARGVLHRAVRPANLLLGEDGYRLSDFSVAALIHEEHRRFRRGGPPGESGRCLAPELRIDPRTATLAADIYGVGACLYVAVTGRPAMDFYKLQDDSPRWEGVPDDLRSVIRRATAREPTERYPSAAAMAEDCLALHRSHGGTDSVSSEHLLPESFSPPAPRLLARAPPPAARAGNRQPSPAQPEGAGGAPAGVVSDTAPTRPVQVEAALEDDEAEPKPPPSPWPDYEVGEPDEAGAPPEESTRFWWLVVIGIALVLGAFMSVMTYE